MNLQGMLLCKLARGGQALCRTTLSQALGEASPNPGIVSELLEGATQGALLGADVGLEQHDLSAGQLQEKSTSFELSFGSHGVSASLGTHGEVQKWGPPCTPLGECQAGVCSG